MAKNKDIWMRKYTYDPVNPRPLPVKMHPLASSAVDELYRRMSLEQRPEGLFTVTLDQSPKLQFEELNAIAEDALGLLNFLGLRSELYLSYRDKQYTFKNPPSRITLDVNMDPEKPCDPIQAPSSTSAEKMLSYYEQVNPKPLSIVNP